jgi:phenylpyruvate tautomerase PptA (4-oxalocrotonate tautomerase family)
MDDQDHENLRYRIAYGHACRILEREMMGPNAPGRDPAEQLRRLLDRVTREMSETARLSREAIAEGVADALEGR